MIDIEINFDKEYRRLHGRPHLVIASENWPKCKRCGEKFLSIYDDTELCGECDRVEYSELHTTT